MKVKSLAVLLLAISVSSVGIATATSNNTDAKVNKSPDKTTTSAPIAPVNNAKQEPADEPGVINGAKNPALIPDEVAYSLLFRVISGNQSAEAKQRMRHYVRQIGLGDQTCYACTGQKATKDKSKDREIDAFIAAADEFQQRVGVLDQQATEIKKRGWPPSPQAMAELTRLQQQKEEITREIVASLPRRLGAEGSNKVWKHVNERVKKKVRIRTNAGQGGASTLALLPSNILAH